jgi:thioredoxin-dependent peroxiredoxin
MATIKEGDKAPHFKGVNQNGKIISSDDFKGKKIILYFYPKDDTPGCTAEACNLAENYDELLKQNFAIVGVSADNEKSHLKFTTKYKLPFDLIADTEKEIIQAYECWGTKKFMGKVYDGIIRKTFIIDENGILLKIFEKVETKTHTQQILKALAEL